MAGLTISITGPSTGTARTSIRCVGAGNLISLMSMPTSVNGTGGRIQGQVIR
ncbi:hypothetical protein [Catenulispora rubra]|uniref:hypothetical protein n=1 Tax=Catenulispora rubra TaxID=280293 RepID=UPI0018923B21|nr:hypothetical protein [Catenulispora rubra]